MARQIGNEAELVAALEGLSAGGAGVGPLSVSLLDFANHTREPRGSCGGSGGLCLACGPGRLVSARPPACRCPPTAPCPALNRPPLSGAVEEQLGIVQQTDILIGMHGAALTYVALMPPHGALVELWPQVRGWAGGQVGAGRLAGDAVMQ